MNLQKISKPELTCYVQKSVEMKGKSQKAHKQANRSLPLTQVHRHLCYSNGNLELYNIPNINIFFSRLC